MKKARMILVGGFLGAGKTTLLARAARRLVEQGQRVGLITNDQAANLVDTGILSQGGFGVGEVAGGCFCCRFNEFVAASERLMIELKPDILFGEPVGSCTDLSATVLQPLKDLYAERLRLAPFSVVADPERLAQALEGDAPGFPASVLYIFRKQLEEADLIVLNKTDLLSPAELSALKRKVAGSYPQTKLLCASALRGEGVEDWLEYVMKEQAAGTRIAEVDYDAYAEGEAMLGWLNCTAKLSRSSVGARDWREFCLRLVAGARRQLRARNAEIAHLKLLLNTAAGSLQANLTSSSGEPLFRGLPAIAKAPPGDSATAGALQGRSEEALLILNARAHMKPDELRAVIEKALMDAAQKEVTAEILTMESFSPSRPKPTHRYSRIV